MYFNIKTNKLYTLMYPLNHHIGFKCVVSFFMLVEYNSRNTYRQSKIQLLKNQKKLNY